MKTAEVISNWSVSGDGENQDGLFAAYSPIAISNGETLRVTDITDQPTTNIMPNPNIYAVRVTTGELTFTALQADNSFLVLNYNDYTNDQAVIQNLLNTKTLDTVEHETLGHYATLYFTDNTVITCSSKLAVIKNLLGL